MNTTYLYHNGQLIGATRKFVGIASPFHARAVLTASECRALGIERSTVIAAGPNPLPVEIAWDGLTFDGEVSFEQPL